MSLCPVFCFIVPAIAFRTSWLSVAPYAAPREIACQPFSLCATLLFIMPARPCRLPHTVFDTQVNQATVPLSVFCTALLPCIER